MEITPTEIESFLHELYTQTGGDPEAQVSMYDIADRIGIDPDQVELYAQSLYIQGYAEMKTLSGGMGITLEGMKVLNVQSAATGHQLYQLPVTETLLDEDKTQISRILSEIKENAALLKQNFSFWEQYILDIKCIEIQLLAPSARTDLIRELFISIQKNLPDQIDHQTTAVINALLHA